jgi:phosphatidylserine/phosphatidylglycerophosphate/cardiolipin synthase-like enzyme
MHEAPWLDPGRTCWRTDTADRAALLIDSQRYFSVVRDAMKSARRSIWVLGWTFDPRTLMDPAGGGKGRDPIGEVLIEAAERGVDVRVLVWRTAPPVAATQGFYPQRAVGRFKGTKVRFKLDGVLPFGACHHQKVVVVDEALGFCGGGDFSVDRWDTPLHPDRDPRRCLPTGAAHAPRHEVMMMVEGAPARILADLARNRWLRAAGEVPARLTEPLTDCWPESVMAEFERVAVGVARTDPVLEAREAEALHMQAIVSSKRTIYLENQYVTGSLIADALAARLGEPDGPEVVVVTTRHSPSWFDRATMDRTRDGFVARLRAADRYGRFAAFTPLTPGGRTIIIHSKVSVIDDRLVRAGSANLNNRSAGFDTECDLAIEAVEPAARAAVTRFRDRLLAHYIEAEPDAFGAAVREGGMRAAVERFDTGPTRRLSPLDTGGRSPIEFVVGRWSIGDPIGTSDAWKPWTRRRALRAQRNRLAAALLAGPTEKSAISGR